MLLHTMSETEIINEVEKDLRWLLAEAFANESRATRKISKFNRKKFPASVTYKYTTPNYNCAYVTYIYVATRTKTDCYLKFNVLMKTGDGRYKVLEVTYKPDHTLEIITIFSAHFFERYVERLNIKQSGIGVVEHFIKHYYHGTFHCKDEQVFEPYPFGVGLGNWSGGKIMYINTFIANDMFFKEQQELANIITTQHNPSWKMVTIL